MVGSQDDLIDVYILSEDDSDSEHVPLEFSQKMNICKQCSEDEDEGYEQSEYVEDEPSLLYSGTSEEYESEEPESSQEENEQP